MIRSVLFILTFAALFAFPWPYAALIAFLASLYIPPVALAFGVFSDALYYTHGTGFPVASLYGVIGFIVAFFANRFIRSNITDFSFE